MLENILRSAASLFVIMGPFASIPIFLALTRGMDAERRASAAGKAVSTAAGVLFFFLFLGQPILGIFMVNFASLKIAGGIVLTILGAELVLGTSPEQKFVKYSPAITLLGSPLLTGPGVIVTTMIFVQEYGYFSTLVAAIIALMCSWAVLWLAARLSKLIGKYWVEAVSRITGLLLTAVAVEFIISGAKMAFIG